jgi:iron complex outermembrane recepter protein
VTTRLSVDVATYADIYPNIESGQPGVAFSASVPSPPHVVLPVIISNAGEARAYGGEMVGTWQVTDRWRIVPGYSFLHMTMDLGASSQARSASGTPGTSPEHQYQVRSLLTLRPNVDWDSVAYHVSSLADPFVPSYTRVDTQVVWRLRRHVELSLVGQNLLSSRHEEFANTGPLHHTVAQRSVFGRIRWQFDH